MKTYLVTGGTGFLGGAVCQALLADPSIKLRMLVRKLAPEWEKRGAEIVVGDVLQRDTLKRAMDGVAGVFHLAGMVSRDPKDGSAMMRVHIEGSRAVIEEAVAGGASRVVVASSSGTTAVSKDPQVFSEGDEYAVSVAAKWPYYASKIYQEKLCFDLGERLGIEVVCVNPSLLLGPGDTRMSSVGDVRAFLKKQIPFVPTGGINFVDVRDAAQATVTAMDKGKPGERYFLGGPNWEMKEFFGRLARVAKVEGPALSLPKGLAKLGAKAAKQVSKALGSKPSIDPVAVDMAQHYWYMTSGKAKKYLDFKPRDPSLTLVDTVSDLRQRI